ncbi:MAG: hypothetical protein ACK5XN_09520 [Bacteroidota bacterium]|jgi:hypothetical protein
MSTEINLDEINPDWPKRSRDTLGDLKKMAGEIEEAESEVPGEASQMMLFDNEDEQQ